MQPNDSEISGLVHRVNLMLANPSGSIVAFIASRSGEGTSTIARTFAEAMASATQRKILILDAGPVDRARFITDGINPGKSIVDAVAAGEAPGSAIYTIEQGLSLGRWAYNPANHNFAGKLLQDDTFWGDLQKSYDMIVIDAPALQISGDGVAMAARADAAIIVVEAETTRQAVIEILRDVWTAAGAKVAGTVLNKRRYYIPQKVYARL